MQTRTIFDYSNPPAYIRRETMSDENNEHGEIIFSVRDHEEVLRITSTGKFYVKGKEVVEDIEIYRGLLEFLKEGGYYGDKSEGEKQ
jgi:hypothetical protein